MDIYTKNPVSIRAIRLSDEDFDGSHPNDKHVVGVTYDPVNRCAIISTLEGEMRAEVGDWIIRGVKDELYPCKNDIFEMTYERGGIVGYS